MSLEDLDPIRRDCKVYILFSRNFSVRSRLLAQSEGQVLRVLGHEPVLVEEALERICNIYSERASVRNHCSPSDMSIGYPYQIQTSLDPRCASS